MLAGNAYTALKDITAMSKERAWSTRGRRVGERFLGLVFWVVPPCARRQIERRGLICCLPVRYSNNQIKELRDVSHEASRSFIL